MEIKKITPEPECSERAAKSELNWMSKGPGHSLENYGFVLRILINRVNQLVDKVNELESRLPSTNKQ